MSELTVREKQILMAGAMVCATLDLRKTKTRRVVTVPANVSLENATATSWDERADKLRKEHGADDTTIGHLLGARTLGQDLMCNLINDVGIYVARCPYGQPGDRLWVRETAWYDEAFGGRVFYDDGMMQKRRGGGVVTASGKPNPAHQKRRPSIHMPRWASRLTLEITEVRVERLQDITPADACAEGIAKLAIEATVDPKHPLHDPMFERGTWGPDGPDREMKYAGARECFAALWDSLNAKRGYGWDVNPWVWVLSFTPLGGGSN